MRGSTAPDCTCGTFPTPATSGWSLTTIHRRTGRWTPSSTRCSRTGSPSRPARCWRVAGAAGYRTGPSRRAGRIPSTAFGVRTRASSSTAATSTGSPTTSTISNGSGPTSSTSPRSSRLGRTIGTTRRRSARSTRCSGATMRCAGSPLRPTDGVSGSSATSRRTTPATVTSGSSLRGAAKAPPNGTSTSGPRGRTTSAGSG